MSAQFMREALSGLAVCQVCPSMAAALAATATRPFCAAIVDCQLADGAALSRLPQLLAQLGDTAALWMTSAEWHEDKQRAYLAAGATACWRKPISARELRAQVSSWLKNDRMAPSLWNDQTAMKRLGADLKQVEALRRMMQNELPTQLARIRTARDCGDTACIREELHRLRAACGFCGADALAASIARWSSDPQPASLDAVLSAAQSLLQIDQPAKQ
ncbi:hypothetical protein IFO71_03580 [Pseudoxanthomonas sp. CAU 1598]|uniref:Response regulatory domain-containing protein n=1 Tax=Pseudomarimonas arenosa TaxID=2774145 RepID=A0AAW3ZIP7_9GAMM|nr:hypothetical protein [Pseudomarimonas arenosa]